MAETLTVYPSAFDSQHSYYSVNSSYPTSNPIGKGSTNTTFTQINLTTGSSAETYFYYDFDLSDIPEGATINSVSCSYKAYISTPSTSYVRTRAAQLYSGSTAKGSAGTFSTNATSTALSSTGTWTRDELQSARIRLYAQRGTSRTTSTYYIRFYGATLTVEYEDNATYYTVTVESDNSITVSPTGENEVREGNSFSISMVGTVTSLTDNGSDVKKNITSTTTPANESLLSYPTSYTTSGSISGTYYQNAIGKGSSNTASGNDYCSSSGSTATIYYSFDFSDLPSDATIQSVSVLVGGHLESTSNSSEVANLQLYTGTTAKGSQSAFTTTSKQVVTMTPGTWTREELLNARLGFTIGYYGGQVNGVDFTVVYTTPRSGGTYYVYTIGSVNEVHTIRVNLDGTAEVVTGWVKINGAWTGTSKLWKKVNGVWVEQSDVTVPFSGVTGGNKSSLIYGGEIT